jgi:hypothetical protein
MMATMCNLIIINNTWWPLGAHIVEEHMTCFNIQRWKKTLSGYQMSFLLMKGNIGIWWPLGFF